jgi:hypothetical protein
MNLLAKLEISESYWKLFKQGNGMAKAIYEAE